MSETCASQKLYFLRHREEPLFKIGISINPVTRALALPEGIDLSASFYVECRKRPRSVEQAIHLMFSEMSVRLSGDGCTEWFSMDCFDDVCEFVTAHKARLGISDLTKIEYTPPATDVALKAGFRMPKEEFLRRIAEGRKQAADEMEKARLSLTPAFPDEIRKVIYREFGHIINFSYVPHQCVKPLKWFFDGVDGSLYVLISREAFSLFQSGREDKRFIRLSKARDYIASYAHWHNFPFEVVMYYTGKPEILTRLSCLKTHKERMEFLDEKDPLIDTGTAHERRRA